MKLFGFSFSKACSLNEKKDDVESGYMLLEVLVATAVASVVVSLMLTALTGLSKAQTRISDTTKILSEEIFEDALLTQVFQNFKPLYHDDEIQFLGEESQISGRTFLDGSSKIFSLSLRSDDDQVSSLILQLEEDVHVVSNLIDGDFSFSYIDHFGTPRSKWDPSIVGMVDRKFVDWAPHMIMIPRQFQIVKTRGNKTEIVQSFTLPHSQFLPRRPEDFILFLGRM